jgi:hypothetical protein
MFEVAGRAAGVAHEGGEFGDEGTETMCRRAIFGDMRVDLVERGR